MIPRRRRDLLYEVLGTKVSARARDPQSGGDENVNAAAGAIVAVGLLVALVLGGYYWSSRTGENSTGAPALSAERSVEQPAVGSDRPSPPARREVGSEAGVPAPRSDSGASIYAVLVRTIRWDAPAKQKEAVEEAERLVKWLDESKLPNVRAVRTPGKNEYEVYVGAAERRSDLEALETKVKQLTYKKRAYYLKDARITNRPLDSGAARNQK
jgi:hypothetical protein